MKFLLALAFLALVTVSFAQYFLPGQTVYTGVGEIALDGHSKIAYHGYQNPYPYNYGYNYNYNYPSIGYGGYGYPTYKRR